MGDRAREPRPSAPLTPGGSKRLVEVEDGIGTPNRLRGHVLERLHEEQLVAFVNSPGFGTSRMIREPSTRRLASEPRDEPPSQPGPRADYRPNLPEQSGDVSALHLDALVDFVNPRGFGYTRDREHVAGFRTHGFTRVPDLAVERVELVSLLKHDEPAVYVSDHLPEMTRLKGVLTRPLDTFEAAGLASLHKGEDLFTDSGRPTRLLGSLRNAKQCVSCHGGERGDLLGAFSYTFTSR